MSRRSPNTGASHLVAALIESGVERLFSLSGNQILSIYDACLDAGLGIIHVRHEAAAVHMADAWGRLTGRPGVALLTAGPGHANGLSALFVARQSESPLVVLSGQSARADDGRGAFQEMPQAQAWRNRWQRPHGRRKTRDRLAAMCAARWTLPCAVDPVRWRSASRATCSKRRPREATAHSKVPSYRR